MNQIPIVRLEVEHMKMAILHAFGERAMTLSNELRIAVDRACHPEVIQATIDKAAREAITESVDNAVRRWWSASEEGQALIKEAVAKRMEEEAKFWKARK